VLLKYYVNDGQNRRYAEEVYKELASASIEQELFNENEDEVPF